MDGWLAGRQAGRQAARQPGRQARKGTSSYCEGVVGRWVVRERLGVSRGCGKSSRVVGCFELSRARGGVRSVVGEGQKGTEEGGWLAGMGAEGRLRGERVVEHRPQPVVWGGKGRVDMGW